MQTDETLPIVLRPERFDRSRSTAPPQSLWGRVWTSTFTALHESRSGEAARLIERYRHLVSPSAEHAQTLVAAAANPAEPSRDAETSS